MVQNDIQRFVTKTIKDLRLYSKIPKRAKTETTPNRASGFSRLISFEEAAIIEKRMIDAGEDIKPKYYKEKNMDERIEERRVKLYVVTKKCIEEKGFFRPQMIRGNVLLQGEITNNEKYFRRVIYEDLKSLIKKGLLYCRGKTYYLGQGEPGEEAKEDSLGARGFMPEKIKVEVSVHFFFH